MSIIRRIEERKRQDAELERELDLLKNDPLAEQLGRRYTPADIEALEYARIGAAWREYRHRKWQKENQS